jgi:hypothetical protein
MTRKLLAAAFLLSMPAIAQPPLPEPLPLPEMIPQVVRWAEGVSRAALARGAGLTPEAERIAREVGVRDPSKVRIEVVDAIPLPRGFELVAGRAGVRADRAGAMTLGYAILLLRGQEGEKSLLRHELRHVAQFEAAGGIAPFLAVHIPDLLRHGYEDSPYERDARAHE